MMGPPSQIKANNALKLLGLLGLGVLPLQEETWSAVTASIYHIIYACSRLPHQKKCFATLLLFFTGDLISL